MFKNNWEKLLEAVWREKLENSLDLAQARQLHLIAEENGRGEINRFLCIGDDRPDAKSVVKRMIRDLAELKLCNYDPRKTKITAVRWTR